jgi:hypothetical protein
MKGVIIVLNELGRTSRRYFRNVKDLNPMLMECYPGRPTANLIPINFPKKNFMA